MTANITDIKRFAVHDGDGIRTTVFFKGCPLRCRWCHNPEGLIAAPQLACFSHRCVGCGRCAALCSVHRVTDGYHELDRMRCVACGRCVEVCPSEALRIYGRQVEIDEIVEAVLADRIFYETTGGGVTLSGGECLLYPEVCAEILRRCREAGISTAVDTCGEVPWSHFEAVLPYCDVFLYDIKAMDAEVHRALTGVSNVRILENLRRLDNLGYRTEIRVPNVPGLNDGEMASIEAFVKSLKHVSGMKILPYHEFGKVKYEALGL